MRPDPSKEKFMGKSLLPFGQHVTTPEKNIALTDFPDMQEMNKELEQFLLFKAAERLKREGKESSAKSTKIHHVDAWDLHSAQFINERAKAFFRLITGVENAVVDLSWASVYQHGDYIMPHAHSRSIGSVVYMVSEGDEDEDLLSGKLVLSDPRLSVCCSADGTYMSNNFVPGFIPGSMIIFPSTVVHMVTPYKGKRPRITLAWNIVDKKLPPRKERESVGIPPHPGRAAMKYSEI